MATRAKVVVSFAASTVLLFTSSCAQTQKVAPQTNANETIVSSVPPFQTKEPERYRATRTITTVTSSGETTITKNAIAKNGELRRDESENTIYLNTQLGRFVLLPNERIFAEVTSGRDAESEESESSPDRLLHVEPISTTYQKLGAETVNGRNTQKYRVVVNGSNEANVTVSETFIWIDEALGMPVKSETRSTDGTRTTMELSDIRLDVDGRIFEIPQDYKKIDFQKVQERLKYNQP